MGEHKVETRFKEEGYAESFNGVLPVGEPANIKYAVYLIMETETGSLTKVIPEFYKNLQGSHFQLLWWKTTQAVCRVTRFALARVNHAQDVRLVAVSRTQDRQRPDDEDVHTPTPAPVHAHTHHFIHAHPALVSEVLSSAP